MNTPVHIALGLAILGRHPRPGDWWALGAGAVLPDLLLFVRAATFPAPPLVTGIDILNSIPLWIALILAGNLVRLRPLVLAASAALLHVLFDLPLHASDAHAHFWPFTGARIESPVSFWDHRHHGRLFGLLEGLVFAACFVVIWRRLDRPWQRAAAVLFALVYVATFVHFLGHAFAGAHWAIW